MSAQDKVYEGEWNLALVIERLPPGWTADHYTPGKPGGRVVVTAGGFGSVTIDFMTRGYIIGIRGFVPHGRRYTGHGWREKLVDDAVAALRGTEVKP